MSIDADSVIGGMPRDEATGAPVGRTATGDLLVLDVVKFCQTIVDAVCQWSLGKLDDPNFQHNIGNLVHLRADGLAPLIVGMPVIA